MSRLSEKVAIVTGASKGIGAGIATALGAAGARVAVNYSSDRQGAERLAQGIIDSGGEAISVGADVSKAAEVARLFKEVHSAFGRLDVLVNNAGVFRFGAFAEITEEKLPPPLQHQRSRGDSDRAGGDQSVWGRRREHHQPQFLSSAHIRWWEPCCTLPRKAPSKQSRERSFGPQAASLLPLECDVLTSKLIQEATFSKVSQPRCSGNSLIYFEEG